MIALSPLKKTAAPAAPAGKRRPLMKRLRAQRVVLRRVAWGLLVANLVTFQAPPAAAFASATGGKAKKAGAAKAKPQGPERPHSRELSAKEMADIKGRGPYRNRGFNGVLPWQRTLRDVNLSNGNLFKSFTDIQVSPARGAGLAWQRTYNSNDDRVGPFGTGWTHAYDIRAEEAATTDKDNEGDAVGADKVARTDFFGGKHFYKRDADGLYTPPAYLYDELSSDYDQFLENGPQEVLSDEQRGMDGTVKHFTSGGADPDGSPSKERVCSAIVDRHGNTTTFTYSTVTMPDSSTKKLLSSITDPSGRSLAVTWTNIGTSMAPAYRITQVAGPIDPSTSTAVYTVAYEYNTDGNLWKVRQEPSGLNRTTTFGYTSYSGMAGTETGLLASIADPLGHTVSYTHSAVSSYYSAPFPTGTVWTETVTEPGSGGTVTWNIASQANQQTGGTGTWAGTQTTTGLDRGVLAINDSQLRNQWLSMGSMYLYLKEYDAANNVIKTTNPARVWRMDNSYYLHPAQIVEATYGPHGNVLTQSLPAFSGETVTTSYYNASKYFQKASVTDAEGNVTAFDYFDNADSNTGNRGQVKWVRDARYATTGEQFDYTYNGYGQKLTETNLNNVVTEYEYGDTWGNLTEVVQDPGGTGHLNRTTAMALDVAGRVTSSTDPKSQSSSFTYNAVGQPTQATLPGETVSYTYGGNGRTASVTDGRGTTSIAYESGNDRVASVTDPVTGTVEYTYNLFGERQTVELPGGDTWTYSYFSSTSKHNILPQDDPNSVGPWLCSVEDDLGNTVGYWGDDLGGLWQAQFAKGSGTNAPYALTEYFQDTGSMGSGTHRYTKQVKNSWNSYDTMTQSWTSTLLVQDDYTYDKNGNRLTNTITSSSGSRTEEYGYDALNRLTGVDYDDGQTQGYTFDPMGNRLTKTDSVNGNESYSYNNANMLLTRGSGGYTNDANGNTLTGGGRTLTWDGQNRLTQCVKGGVTSSFVYGADGLRRQSTVGSVTTDFILDGQSVVRSVVSGGATKTYLHGARGPEYERTGSGSPLWYLYDGLGSVLGTVDSTGTLQQSRKYDVYGAVRASSGGSGTAHKWVGGLGHPSEDDTGLVYMRARYYDPIAGRFTSEDPARDGNNWFIYVNCRRV